MTLLLNNLNFLAGLITAAIWHKFGHLDAFTFAIAFCAAGSLWSYRIKRSPCDPIQDCPKP